MNIFDQLGNPDSRIVKDALQRSCDVCKAPPGQACTRMPINGFPLENRVVHYSRTVD